MRLGLGTYNTANEVARAYDVAAWRLNRTRREMNFFRGDDARVGAAARASPRVVTKEDRRLNRRLERRLGIAKMDEHVIAE
ncbi:Ethylene-responsive transcription factor CRF1 [Hordeum vulgare]|nr:Ethylene-responsive transcription factor CRF1 [Hordeum vulgare]